MSSELPTGWLMLALPDVCDINPPKPQADALPADAPVTFVPMPAVDAQRGVIANPTTRPFSTVRKGFTAFRDEDVIMAKITPCMENGKAAIARGLQNGLGFGSTEFHVLRTNGAVLPAYVYHFIRQESFRRLAEQEMTGSVGQKRVPASFLEKTELPLPPLIEQLRIVAKVEALLARVSAARERLANVPVILKRFRQSVLAAACSGCLTADWREQRAKPGARKTVRLCDIGAVTGGLTKNARRPSLPLQVPYLRVANVYENRLELGQVISIGVTAEEYQRMLLKRGDLLFVEGNGSIDQIGRVAMWDGSIPGCVHQNHLIRFRASAGVLPEYVLLWMMAPQGREQLINQAISSAGLHSLSISKVAAVELELTDLEEQHETVCRVSALFKLADAIEKRVAAATRRADKLTQAILAKAFRGELVPTEAELARAEGRDYEPASVLLERIRAANGETGNKTDRSRRRTEKGSSRRR